ncbi:hypothetical protein SARC_11357 [Sphaeroforma arctica JP610]|uniref:Mitochondrial escape protein 2 C-terminal domain-containing protein n=1 Tax=Sphaeroforma arctica JP610 TaxID=667725 RepID=A0A0L0FH84_9EUKA|nr:hypothetical protein SARC_11357 [Sphaeroforma arctica JP610]KNC76134.1 hypothetical protein SARC_11357 [Sphaeroforma arctica JP610]|eukprot:XP_014150036.1 hypothetical protein SARC_11357 [Sphaeroforma arctica JP610]
MGLSPSIRIHMKNSKGTSMTLETIYGHARKYGHIRNIEPHTPYTDKVYVTYHRSIDAAAAMKCMNRIPIQSIVPEANGQLPTLCMVYEPPIRFNVWNFVMNHTKLVVPAVIAVTGFLSYTLFEPIRVWFVEQNIRYFTKLRKTYAKGMNMLGNTTTQLTQYFGYRGVSGDEDKGGVSEQKLRLAEAIGSIAEELTERVNESFIEDSGALVVIAGPPGSGKSFVAHHLIENASHMLFIDFSDHTVRGQPNSSYIESKLIRSTGYFPSVLWMNRLVKLSEGIATATMGIKTEGLSSTSLDSTRSILNTLTNALVKFRAAHPQTDDELLEMAVEETDTGEGEQEGMAGATESVLGDEKADKEKGVLDTVLSRFRAYEEIGKVEKPADGVLETVAGYTHTVTDPIVTLAAPITNLVSGSNSAKEETNKDEMAQKRAAPKPKVKGVPTGVVIVIEGLDRNLTDKFPWLMDVLFEWVSQMNLQHADCARVVMVTSDSQLAEDAANAMATPVHLVPMRDLPVDQAAELLSSLSTRDVSKDKLKRAIGTIGGRFNDIQLLSKRINVGMDVESATVMMVEEAVDFLRNHGLSISPLGKGKANAWTVEQMWYIITKLAENDSVPLDEVLFSPLFGGDMQPIRAMVEQRMLTVEGPHDSHNKYLVKPIRPVLGAACKELVKDERLSKAMTGKMYATQINKVNTTMQQLEDEMQKLLALGAGAWTGNGTALNDRLKYVTEQISAQSKKMRDLQARKPL